MKLRTLLLALSICVPLSALGQHNHGSQTPYAGMQNRAIKSLSDDDIKELRRGGGWGLALAAELNGMPGPAHLLELKDQIPLTDDQVAKTQALLNDMRQAAIPMTLARISPPGITPKCIDATWGATDHVYPPLILGISFV